MNDPLEKNGVDRWERELPLLLVAREEGEELTDTRCLFERGEILQHLVQVQRLFV